MDGLRLRMELENLITVVKRHEQAIQVTQATFQKVVNGHADAILALTKRMEEYEGGLVQPEEEKVVPLHAAREGEEGA